MQTKTFQAALGGLLHNINHFFAHFDNPSEATTQFIKRYVQPAHQSEILAVCLAQQTEAQAQPQAGDSLAATIALARQIAVGQTTPQTPAPSPSALQAIWTNVILTKEAVKEAWYYYPAVLGVAPASSKIETTDPQSTATQSPIFPRQGQLSQADLRDACQQLWQTALQPALETWRNSPNWAEQSPVAYLTTLTALLQQHLSLIAATHPQHNATLAAPPSDVSLFQHLKITAALAVCLSHQTNPPTATPSAQANQPIATLVRFDFSGIQDFIYQITKVGATDFSKVAKGLRGRSFYLLLLSYVLAQWLLEKLALPVTNLIFASGGQVDLLIPPTKTHQNTLNTCLETIETWLLNTFQGELSIHLATAPMTAADFSDISPTYRHLNQSLTQAKQKKWHTKLSDPTFFIDPEPLYHRCAVCRITPLADPGVCELCEIQREIGQWLGNSTHLAFIHHPESLKKPSHKQGVLFNAFNLEVCFLNNQNLPAFNEKARQNNNLPITLYQLNPSQSFIATNHTPQTAEQPLTLLPHIGYSYLFVANTPPKATAYLKEHQMHTVKPTDVLHFDALAHLSQGVKHIGILRADVDHLGLLFSLGLQNNKQGVQATFSRITTLSNALDLFFSGWLNQLTQTVFKQWQAEQSPTTPHPWHNKVDGLFYIMYAGGDDLFIIGPWDSTLTLAQHLNQDFQAYACHNPNVTLSAGVVQVKPHYPVQRFAKLAGEAEETAKHAGRNRITVFNQTVEWHGDSKSLAPLLEFGQELQALLAANKIPRGLLPDLVRLYQIHHQQRTDTLKPMWTPRLFYTLARRLDKSLLQTVGRKLMDTMAEQSLMVPVSYASFITRKF